MGFFGFNNKRISSLGGDFDGDGVKNKKDCEPMNWKKQDRGKCSHMYHDNNVNKNGNEVCLFCEKERTKDERVLKEMFK